MEPNVYSVWIKLVEVLGGVLTALAVPLGGVLAYYLNRKLNNIHTLVNGNLHTALKKVDELRGKLQAEGIDPDA